MKQFTVNVVQMEISRGQPDDGTLERMISAIRSTNCDLVVFPELATTGYHIFDQIDKLAEPVPGPTTNTLSSVAKESNTAILFGMPVKDGTNFYNSAIWIDRDGKIQAQYNKRHCWGNEQKVFSTGERYKIVDSPFGRIGIQICYDLNFPAASAALVQAECDLLINISAWTTRMERDWRTLLPARAIEQGAYVVGCNFAGTDAGSTFCGRSVVIEPDGTSIVEMGTQPGQTSATLYPGVVEAERQRNPMRKDRNNSDEYTENLEVQTYK